MGQWAFLALVCALSGTLVAAGLRLCREKVAACVLGTVGALAAQTTLAYALSVVSGSLAFGSLAALALVTAAGAFSWLRLSARARLEEMALDRVAAWVFGLAFVGLLPVSAKLLFEHGGGLWTGILNAFGDIAWHTATATSFAEGQGFPPENPIFAGEPLVYPFLVNFLSATLLRWGASVPSSMTGPALLLLPLTVTLYYVTVRELCGRKRVAASSVLFLVFGGASFGWLRIFADFQAFGGPWYLFPFHLPVRDYSGVGSDPLFHFLNPVACLFLPQRSFLFGMPLALGSLVLWAKGEGRRSALAAGLFAGMLPLFHAHTAIALLPALLIAAPRERWRDLKWALLPALLVGIPEALYYVSYGKVSSHLSLHAFWMANGASPVLYWLKNAGLVFPAAAAALFLPADRALKRLALAGLLLFLLGNGVQLARWIWDNYKIFIFAWLFCVPAAVDLAYLALGRRAALRPLVVGLMLAHLLSGVADIWKTALPTASSYEVWDAASVAVAEKIRRETPPAGRFLQAPIHNSAVFLAGRRSYLGYPAHAWSHGWDTAEREAQVRELFSGTRRQPKEVTLDYALVGPAERSRYQDKERAGWRLLFKEKGYELYRLGALR
jgi:hypothetical protein